MNILKTSIVAAAFAVVSGAASAATLDFVVDWGNSNVALTDQGSGGVNCLISGCGVSASLVGSGGVFTLNEGETEEFGFIRFRGEGTTGSLFLPNDRDFDIEATLAFNPPTASASGSGEGGAHILDGWITAGNLDWQSGVPTQLTLSDGSLITIDFEEGDGLLLDGDKGYTLKAYVTADYIAPIPLPAGALLLLGGLGALGAVRKRAA